MVVRSSSSARSRLGTALVAGSIFALAMTGTAGVQLVTQDGDPYAWDLDEAGAANVQGGKISYYLDPAGPDRFVQGDRTHLQARTAGIHAWEIGTSRLRFVPDNGRIASGRNGGDRVNYVGFADGGLGPFTFAVTYPTRSGTRLIDSDVILNAKDFTWSSRTPGLADAADVESLVAHEWGHAIGLDHVPLRGSTMYFSTGEGNVALRSLEGDDRAVIGSIYPNGAFQQTTGSIAGRALLDTGGDHRGLHVIAISVSTLEPAASTLTEPDGDFRIEGLPQGAYRLLVAPTLPLSPAMNAWWQSANTSFLPAWLRAGGTNPGALATLDVRPGGQVNAGTITVLQVSDPLEPDDVPNNGTSIDLGDGICARLERGGDLDVYVFEGRAGQIVTAALYAHSIGASCDPALALLRISGQPVASNADIRAPNLFERQPQGADLDARLLAVTLPADDTYFLRVSRQDAGNAQDAFYALSVSVASNAPSSALTRVSTDRDRLDAGSGAVTSVVVTPRRETGDDVGPGATVELTNDGDGVLGGVQDNGDGTYTAQLTAAPEPGADRITVTVTTNDGVATLQDALLVVYLGPLDAARSTFTASPRRIDADGAATSTLVVLPRDARGELLGPGRDVRMDFTDSTQAQLGTVFDQLDGGYAAVVTSAPDRGSATVRARVDGEDAGLTAEVVFGFPLDEVLDQAVLDVETDLADTNVKKAASKLLAKSLKKLEKAIPDAAPGPGSDTEKRALQRSSQAVKQVANAVKKGKGTVPDRGTAGELARAVRDAAQAAVDRSVIVTGQDQKRVDQARRLLSDGQVFFDGALPKKAVKRWLKAFKKVRKLAVN